MTVFFDTLAVPGAWADALRFVLFPVETYPAPASVECRLDTGQRRDDPDAFTPVSLSLHSSTDTAKGQDNHA